MFITAPIRGDTVSNTMDTTAQVGFTKGPETPSKPIVPGQPNNPSNSSTNAGYQLTNTSTPSNSNKYLPQTNEAGGQWASIIGLSLMGTLSIAYVTKLKTTYKL